MRIPIVDIAPTLSFDGVNDSVKVAHASSLMISTGSWGCWAFIRGSSTTNGFGTLMNKCSTSGWLDGYGISVVVNAGALPHATTIRFYTHYTNAQVSVSVGGYLNGWHHFAATYDGAVIRAYIDGEEVGQAVAAGTITSNTASLFIGAAQSAVVDTPGYFSNSCIGDVFVSSTVFTSAQLKRLMGRDAGVVSLCASFWKLNDGPGATSAADSVGSNTGTISGATNTVFGPSYSRRKIRNVPYSLKFTYATGSKVTLDAAATTNYGTGSFTFGTFIKPYGLSGTPAANIIFSSYAANVASQKGFVFTFDATLRLTCLIDSTPTDLTTVDTLSMGTWQHVGLRRDGDTVTIFINGIPSAMVTGMAARDVVSTVAGRLGEHPASVGVYNPNAFIAEPAFFGRALSDAEVLAWARQGIDAVSQASITARYDFIDAPSTSITDSSGNAHTATASSVTWSRESPIFLRPSLLENPVFNGDLVLYPSFTAATTTAGRWIDGTAAGSTANDFWNWAIPALGVTAPGSAQFDSSVFYSGSIFASQRSLKLSTNSALGAITVCNSLDASSPAASRYLTPLLPSTAYVITAMVKTSNCATNSAFIDLREFTGALASVTTTSSNKLSGTNDWTEVSISVTTNATTRFGLILLRNNVTGNTSDAWFTDIRVRLA